MPLSQGLKWRWVVLGGLLAHLCTIAVVALAAIAYANLASPASGAEDFPVASQRAGLIVGPTIGAPLACLFGVWAARRCPGRERVAGTMVGGVAALILLPLLATASPTARNIYLASMGLKLAAGAAGGWIVWKREVSRGSGNAA